MKTGKWDDIRDKLDFKRVGKPAIIGMAAVLVLVAALSVNVLAGAATTRDFVVEASSRAAQADGTDSQPETVFVHVTGSVANPGVYELESGSRVLDAVQAAGGFTDDADAQSCNLARVIQDSEQIHIPSASESRQPETGQVDQTPSSSKVNINTATQAELESLPGIGETTARKIIADRSSNGPFKSVEDLTRVSGIGDKKLSGIIDLICV